MEKEYIEEIVESINNFNNDEVAICLKFIESKGSWCVGFKKEKFKIPDTMELIKNDEFSGKINWNYEPDNVAKVYFATALGF